MNIVAAGQRFFIFGGIVLMAIAAVQLLSRRRGQGRPRPTAWLDAARIQALVFLVVGLLTLLAGVGVIPVPGGR